MKGLALSSLSIAALFLLTPTTVRADTYQHVLQDSNQEPIRKSVAIIGKVFIT